MASNTKGKTETTTGNPTQNNSAALEDVLDGLTVAPDRARIALLRTMAMAVDAGAGPSAWKEYNDLLSQVVEAEPDQPDELDEYD